MECGGSAVESRSRNRQSLVIASRGSNPLLLPFQKICTFVLSMMPQFTLHGLIAVATHIAVDCMHYCEDNNIND